MARKMHDFRFLKCVRILLLITFASLSMSDAIAAQGSVRYFAMKPQEFEVLIRLGKTTDKNTWDDIETQYRDKAKGEVRYLVLVDFLVPDTIGKKDIIEVILDRKQQMSPVRIVPISHNLDYIGGRIETWRREGKIDISLVTFSPGEIEEKRTNILPWVSLFMKDTEELKDAEYCILSEQEGKLEIWSDEDLSLIPMEMHQNVLHMLKMIRGPAPDEHHPFYLVEYDPLFTTDVRFQSDLDNQQVPQDLQQEFEENDIPLSDSFTVSVDERGNRWSIVDQHVYTVRKMEDRLDVYGKTIIFENGNGDIHEIPVDKADMITIEKASESYPMRIRVRKAKIPRLEVKVERPEGAKYPKDGCFSIEADTEKLLRDFDVPSNQRVGSIKLFRTADESMPLRLSIRSIEKTSEITAVVVSPDGPVNTAAVTVEQQDARKPASQEDKPKDGIYTLPLKYDYSGKVHVKVKKSGYRTPESKTLDLSKDERLAIVFLTPKELRLKIRTLINGDKSKVEGIRIYRVSSAGKDDGDELPTVLAFLGKTDKEGESEYISLSGSGRYHILLKHPEYVCESRDILDIPLDLEDRVSNEYNNIAEPDDGSETMIMRTIEVSMKHKFR